MSDPLLSFICKQEDSSSSAAAVGLEFVPTSSPIDHDQSEAELSLFPELLGSGDVDFEKVATLTTKPEKTQTQGKTTVVKVKMVPKAMQNPEEQLIEYLTGRCQKGGFDVENIVDVTGMSDISDDTTFDLSVGDFELEEAAPTKTFKSSRSVGKGIFQQTFDNSSEFASLSGRPPCSLSASKAAQAARENRIKKKNYIAGLQKNLNDLSTENRQLKSEVGNLKGKVGSLSTEVQYLKNVLANQSALSSLLKNTLKTPGVQFLASEFEDTEVPRRETVHCRKTTKRSLEEDLFLSSDEEDGEPVAEPPVSMQKKKGVPSRMATRFGSRKMTKLDHDYAGFEKKAHSSTSCASGSFSDDNVKENINNNSSGGICLHVSNQTVSMEFCSECSKRASITRRRHQPRYRGNCKMEQVQV